MLEVKGLSKHYDTPGGPLPILSGVDLVLAPGDAIAVMGPSGSGKSTLLHLLGVLDLPSAGTIVLDGQNPFQLGESQQAAFRNQHVGFVFQDHALLPQCSVLENVLIPTLVAPPGGYESRARDLLGRVGLTERVEHRPAALSGGERQRAAIARALIRQPRLLLCDEPTGNLDADTARRVADVLFDLHKQQNTILVAVTHSEAFASGFPRRYQLAERRLRLV